MEERKPFLRAMSAMARRQALEALPQGVTMIYDEFIGQIQRHARG